MVTKFLSQSSNLPIEWNKLSYSKIYVTHKLVHLP